MISDRSSGAFGGGPPGVLRRGSNAAKGVCVSPNGTGDGNGAGPSALGRRSFGIGAVVASCSGVRVGDGGVSSSAGKSLVVLAGSASSSGSGQLGGTGQRGLTNSGAGVAESDPAKWMRRVPGGDGHGRRPSTSRSGATASAA